MPKRNSLCLPRAWRSAVQVAVLHVISMAQYTLAQGRGKFFDRTSSPPRMAAENERLRQEIALTREELRIKDARMAAVPVHRRPHYAPPERMAILELRALRGWSLAQAARTFLVTPPTIAEWMRRLDEQGPDPSIALREPVNKFPDLIGYLVRRLRQLAPTMGKRKIAELLARAGLHLGTTTIRRMLRQSPPPRPVEDRPAIKPRVVTARRPNHVWHVDLTCMPIGGGFWTPRIPFALPQCWPYCWWVAVVVDHYSRRVIGVATFKKQPNAEDVRAFLCRAIEQAGVAPKYLVCDRGGQFDNAGFRRWCRRRGIRPRYGAVGKHGSIAVVERFILTLKTYLATLPLVPLRRRAMQHELACFVGFYNEHRPHTALGGRTPNERYYGRYPANRRPRSETRNRWPRGSPCAKPWAPTRGKSGAQLTLEVEFHAGRTALPVVTLRRAA